MDKIPSRLQLLVRSCCFLENALETDIDVITKNMMDKKEFSCEVEDRTLLSLTFTVIYQDVEYLAVFVLFQESALNEEEIDVVITKK